MRLRLYYHSPPCVISHPAHNLPCVYQQTRTNRSDRRRTARVTILAGYYYWDIPIALKKSEKATGIHAEHVAAAHTPPVRLRREKQKARTCKKRIGTRRLLLFLAEEIHRGCFL